MTLLDILTGPWAITPDKLLELQAVYATHLRGDKIDLEAIEARLGRPLASEQRAYQIVDGTAVAVLEISGVIAPKANMFTRISGGAAASLLQQQVQSLAADSRVKAVVIDMDSPGGNVLGIPALAEAVRALAAVKPTVTVSTGMLASAAYWVGSAANAVFLSGATDFAGSIGVVATHSYNPRAASSTQTTEITAGRYKRMASDRAPLDAEGRAYLQAQVDELYRVFVDAVSQHRQASADDVLAHMADGRIFIGRQAIDAGLADGFSTVDAMVERLAADPTAFATRQTARLPGSSGSVRPGKPPAAGAAAASTAAPAAGPVRPLSASGPASPTTHQGPTPMPNPQELAASFAAENPAAAEALRAEGHAQGRTAEGARIKAVREQLMPGHEALIEQLASDGKTTGPEAAVAVLAAERARLGAMATSRASDAPAPVTQALAPAAEPVPVAAKLGARGRLSADVDAAALDAAARAYIAAHPGTAYLAAVKAVQTTASAQQGA